MAVRLGVWLLAFGGVGDRATRRQRAVEPDQSAMYNSLGHLVNRYWLVILLVWLGLAVGLRSVAPSWDEVALDGDFDYLPATSTSLRGTKLLQQAFPDEKAKSSVVIIFSRDGEPLTGEDRDFALQAARDLAAIPELPLVGEVWTETTRVVGRMLRANGDSAVMIVARLSTDMMAVENVRQLYKVQALLDVLRAKAPAGLELGLSGSAMIGGDMQDSVRLSLTSTETTTVVLVLLALITIYRAPLLVLIPMSTIAVSLLVASDIVALAAQQFHPSLVDWGGIKVFTTTKIFVVVILFGAGTDFCLFLISRFKEELGHGAPVNEASGKALSHVGDALVASAFTTIMGLATMVFADYGKFVYSGPIVAVCLAVALLACITFAPALLRAMGSWVFWPYKVHHIADHAAEGHTLIGGVWDRVATIVIRHPVAVLGVALWLASPFIWAGLDVKVSHDFMRELDPSRQSVPGTQTVRDYFSPGEASPTTLVARIDGEKLDDPNNYAIAFLHKLLYETPGVTDVRSLYQPGGGKPGRSGLLDLAASGSPLAVSTFVSQSGDLAGKVTQLSMVFDQDPFSREARALLGRIESKLAAVSSGAISDPNAEGHIADEALRNGLAAWKGAQFEMVGSTPGIRDLEVVTISDQSRIQICVMLAVFAVILVIIRKPVACTFLMVTVLLSYWGTIGLTELFFEWLYGASFDGLDWKVPIFLFVILIAVGQDYNIYLTTRVFEEQAKLPLLVGLRRAIVQTGGIITSCGVIMAGTFVAMMTGNLRGMTQLGFSLSLGVLIDTFFVRTVVVPCYFSLVARWMGEKEEEVVPPQLAPSSTADAARAGQSNPREIPAPHVTHATEAVS